MNSGLDFDRLFFDSKTAILLGAAATLAATGVAVKWMNTTYTVPNRLAFMPLVVTVAMTIGAALLFVAMCLYWMKCDNSSKSIRIFWFFVLLFGLFSGAPQVLYFLIVYLPHVRRRLRELKGERSV